MLIDMMVLLRSLEMIEIGDSLFYDPKYPKQDFRLVRYTAIAVRVKNFCANYVQIANRFHLIMAFLT
ncbi:hypothetical protein RIR_jg3494.t1 [Rhizophagus irregularis DAOM 181602=DAOM 197198]|nr:hypothetical protein RIR_jg3494.t1 [Rhizophagus irregularis DAOM 181602=DAOM 197198]